MTTWKKCGGDMWDFTVNPELIGKYVDMVPANKEARKSSVITLEVEGKEIKFWGSTVLDNHFGGIHQGEMVKVVFLGMGKSKSGAEYKNFEVYHEEIEKVIDPNEPPAEAYEEE
jgi:hypothetical protein